jgi:hypothetical protein
MPTFYKSVLVEIPEHQVLGEVYPERIANQLTLQERLPNCECEDCKEKNWIILPKESPYTRDSGKPYIQCMNCGYLTHL